MNSFEETLQNCLSQFSHFEKRFPGPIPNSVTFSFSGHKGHVLFGSLVHGNEVGSLPGILFMISQLAEGKLKYGGQVTFFLGNVKAALENKRYLDYDLNRSFGRSAVNQETRERKRAQELMTLIDQADIFLDFHQTNRPSLFPFYIFSMHALSFYWAQSIGVGKAFVTRKPGSTFSTSGMCSDEYARNLNKAGITLELGEKGFQDQAAKFTITAVRRTLKCADLVFTQSNKIENLCHKNESFEFYSTIYAEQFEGKNKILASGISNFDELKAGQVIGKHADGGDLVCPQDGAILFPKYFTPGQPHPEKGELYVLAKKMKFHPLKWL
jgi:succinylglutamate desuccinylase